METPAAGRTPRIAFAALAFAVAFLASGAAVAADVERRIPVVRDAAGSDVTVEISREGTRQTATPVLAVSGATVERIEDRIARKVAELARHEIPSAATVVGSLPEIGPNGTPGKDPGEITARGVRAFLKRLQASRKERPMPAAVVAVPPQRLGMADPSPR